MRTGFKNPIEGPSGQKKSSPWDFRCPPYDERTSCYVNAGNHEGVGYRQPVGHEGNPKTRVSSMPFGRPETIQTYHPGAGKNMSQEYIE